MMAVGNITDINNMQPGYAGRNMQADSVSKNIQKQIADAQKQLQELSSNEDMSIEEKMKKRQEIQQKITNLNQQLMQYQTRQRKQQQNGSSIDSLAAKQKKRGKAKAGINKSTLSQAGMESMLSAGSSIEQAKIQGSVATKMEGRAGVLESEIKLDQVRGNDTSKKQEELADAQQKAQAATSSQLSTLADASRTMEKAAQADGRTEKTDDKDTKTAGAKEDGVDENMSGADVQKETASGSESVNTQADASVSESAAAAGTTTSQPTAYVSVDIRL